MVPARLSSRVFIHHVRDGVGDDKHTDGVHGNAQATTHQQPGLVCVQRELLLQELALLLVGQRDEGVEGQTFTGQYRERGSPFLKPGINFRLRLRLSNSFVLNKESQYRRGFLHKFRDLSLVSVYLLKNELESLIVVRVHFAQLIEEMLKKDLRGRQHRQRLAYLLLYLSVVANFNFSLFVYSWLHSPDEGTGVENQGLVLLDIEGRGVEKQYVHINRRVNN